MAPTSLVMGQLAIDAYFTGRPREAVRVLGTVGCQTVRCGLSGKLTSWEGPH